MNKAQQAVIETQKTKSYIDFNKYHCNNIFGITKTSRWELMHSNFLKWILDKDSNLCPNFYSIYQFISMLNVVKDYSINVNAKKDEKTLNLFMDLSFISDVIVKREFHNIDVLIEVSTRSEKILPIVVENKVDSSENGKNKDQTKVYFDFAENFYKDKTKYLDVIYVFLAPAYNKTPPKQKEYIHVNYQDLVDFVIEPVMHKCNDGKSIENIKNYLQCLSFQSDNEKGDKIMAISSDEKEIIDAFKRENRNLIALVLSSLEDLPDNIKDEAIASVRDDTVYEFNGKTDLGKGKLVLEVVKKYVEDKSADLSFSELEDAFPKRLRGAKTGRGVIELDDGRISDSEKGIGKDAHRRFFINDPIKLNKETALVLVCTEWGIGNISPFLAYARDSLKYNIREYHK